MKQVYRYQMEPDKVTNCEKCRRPIFFVKTVKGKLIPLDYPPNAKGNVTVSNENGVNVAHVYKNNAAIKDQWPIYLCHFASCPAAAHFRKKK